VSTRTLAALGLLSVLTACPAAPVASSADARLGTLVYETDAQEYGRLDLLGHDGHVLFARRAVAANEAGDRFVLVTFDASRPFASTSTDAAFTVFKKVSANEQVTTLTPPVVGSDSDPTTSFLRIGGAGQPYLFEVPGPGLRATTLGNTATPAWNPVGVLLDVQVFDGSRWKRAEFLRADRPASDDAQTWDLAEDQVRVIGSAGVVVQHGDTLSRFDGTGWKTVTLPADVAELRLGNADASQVRAYWLTHDGTFKTDLLHADGTWAGQVASLKRGTAPKLQGAWGFSGTVDRFTVSYAVGNAIEVLRFEDGALRQAAQRQPIGRELHGDDFFYGTTHGDRAAFNQAGTLLAFVDGVQTGTLVTLPAKAMVACPAACTVGEGHPVAVEASCAVCVPREVRLASLDVAPDVSALNLLLSDELQDATLRLYVKRWPLPTSFTNVSDDAGTTGRFPGEGDAGVADEGVVVSGTVLLAGATTHGQTTLALSRAGQPLESLTTQDDGTFQFSKQPVGTPLSVRITHAPYVVQDVTVDASSPGPQVVQRVLVPNAVRPTSFAVDAGTETLLSSMLSVVQRDGARLLGPTPQVYTTNADASPVRVVTLPSAIPAVLWHENGLLKVNSSSVTFDPASTFDSVRVLGTSVAIASGVPDSTTPLTWKALTSALVPLYAQPLVEVATVGPTCNVNVIWTSGSSGDVRASLATCATPLVPLAPTLSTGPVTPMRALTVGAGNDAFGFVGPSCGVESGFQVPCPVQTLSVVGNQPVTATLNSSGAVDVQLQASSGGRRLVVLEPGALKVAGSTVTTGFTLPTSYGPSETPLTLALGSSRIFVRTTAGLFASTGAVGSWAQVLPDVVRVVRAPPQATSTTAVLWQAKPGKTSCAEGCTLYVVVGSGAPVALPGTANGNERVTELGVYSDGTTWTGPDGQPGPLITYTSFAGVITPLGQGTLFPDVLAAPVVFGAPQDITSSAHLAVLQFPQATVSLSAP
jgi:hypothetical protein